MEMRSRLVETGFDQPAGTVHTGWRVPRQERLYRRALKRWVDVGFVLLALPIVLPVLVVLGAILIAGGQSPFYAQQRIGKGGRLFTLWKLRSMVPNAETRLMEHLRANDTARQEWNAFQKLSHDPRITAFGRFLRMSSLDELPQLWNVLVGDMSLVGPRPMMPEQQDLYPGSAYYALRPGLTGLWQVSDRNQSTFAQRAEFDAAYDRNLSLAGDLKILLATVGVVLRATGK